MRILFSFYIITSSLFSFGQLQEKWLGHYVGELSIYSISGTHQVYHMELLFNQLTTDTYEWTIVYGEDSLRQERKYILISKGDNIFEIDEQNGIVLSCNLIGNKFISTFEVANNLIHVTYTFTKNQLIFDLSSSTSKFETGAINTTDSSEVPVVISYQTTTLQNALLKRQK